MGEIRPKTCEGVGITWVHVAQRASCAALHADAANCPAAQTAHAAQPRSAVEPAPQGCASNSAPGAHALRQAVHSVLSGAAENRPLGHSSQVRSGVARVPAGHTLPVDPWLAPLVHTS